MKLTKDYFIEGKIIKAGTELEIVTEAKKSVDKLESRLKK
jgi:hypothetical protein